jgi:hypothetical protein
LISAGIVALTAGFGLGLHAIPSGIASSAASAPQTFAARAALASPETQGFQLASFETTTIVKLPPQVADEPTASVASPPRIRTASAVDLPPGTHAATFAERFAGAFDWPAPSAERQARAGGAPPASSDSSARPAPRHSAGPLLASLSPLPALPPTSPAKKQIRGEDAAEDASPTPDADEHTAIYDIAAHRVYMPNGQRLEAHSGLGNRLDDPRYVSERDRGPTPPNVYDLSLREESFHGVRALRLTPVGSGKMYGRDGLLAHTYMLGPNGQSNGCVSFSDYQVFLNAYLSGEITRLVVVDHLATPPNSKTASGWIPEKIRALFGAI